MMLMSNRPRISPRIKKRKEEMEENDNNSSGNSNNEQQQLQQRQLQRGFRRRATTALASFSAPSRNRHFFTHSSSTSNIGSSVNNNNIMAPAGMMMMRSFSGASSSASTVHDDAASENGEVVDDASSCCSEQQQQQDVVEEESPLYATNNSLSTSRHRPTYDYASNHTIVLYQPSSSSSQHQFDDINGNGGVIQSWCQVVHAAHAVWQSREMERLQMTTCNLLYVTTRTALQTALLPVTVPYHIVSTSTRCVVDTSKFVVCSASQLVLGSTRNSSNRGGGGNRDATSSSSALITHEASTQQQQQRDGGIIDLPGRVFGFVGHVTFQLIVGKQSSNSKYINKDDDDFLDRLRLDYYDEPDVSKDKNKIVVSAKKDKEFQQPQDDTEKSGGVLPVTTVMMKKACFETSKFLLRVDDLELYCDADVASNSSSKSGNSMLVLYIDLDAAVENHHKSILAASLQASALSEFTLQGLAMIANHPTVRLTAKQCNMTTSRNEIVWKCEGSCQRIMRQMSKMSTMERLQTLEKETLVWSGQFRHQHVSCPSQQQQQQQASRRSMPLYLARGIIRCSPREFVNLLWDNTRTSTYNNFCAGRVTILDLDDSEQVLSGKSDVGTKVIQSETRIPFTNMSVSIYCLMHVRPLQDPDEGFVIMSRSLVTGTAGMHTTGNSNFMSIQEGSNKNEIIWGMNIIRRVPNRPYLADLTSLSQGGSSLVPKFVFGKIAMMGISEFFDNVRKLDLTTSTAAATKENEEQ